MLRSSGAVPVAERVPQQGHVPDLPYLGEGNVRRFHANGELQQVTLPDDPRPFLIPKRVITTVESEKGTIVVTNDYKLGSPSGGGHSSRF